MGVCVICGRSAGWFRSVHAECRRAEKLAEEEKEFQQGSLIDEARRLIVSGCDATEVLKIVDEAGLADSDRQQVLVTSWSQAVEEFLEDGVLSEEEDERLHNLMQASGIDTVQFEAQGALTKAGKASVLRNLMAGEVVSKPFSSVPVNLQRGESVVWEFFDVDYLEDQTKREWRGGSQGVSIRVMSGVYYRVGSFKGRPVYTTERKLVDRGALVVTTKHLYFVGPATSKKIPYSKIVSFEQFTNGIGLMRDAATAKPQIFVVGDGWFAYNLIANLAQLTA